ncbi:hypothetical protein L484_004815 [Morus notabilis]|uniref:Uncharacterized protein n=1 Tax=Morus notabilis TaxID=981085 RepID=W9RYN9_9ROSA|nr:hypothetical protein L484_004815 [Morus notabilis]
MEDLATEIKYKTNMDYYFKHRFYPITRNHEIVQMFDNHYSGTNINVYFCESVMPLQTDKGLNIGVDEYIFNDDEEVPPEPETQSEPAVPKETETVNIDSMASCEFESEGVGGNNDVVVEKDHVPDVEGVGGNEKEMELQDSECEDESDKEEPYMPRNDSDPT